MYAVFGCLWIASSDAVLGWFVHEPESIKYFAIAKGLTFIVLTASLLYLLLYRFTRRVDASEQSLRESEERYRRLFEVETDAILMLDRETLRLLDANPAALALYGYTLEEFLALTTDDISAEPEITRRSIAGNDTKVSYRLHRKKDGSVFPVELAGNFFSFQGRELHVAAIRDISERIRIEEALKSHKERLRIALKTSRMGVWEWDLQTNAVFRSPESLEILGMEESCGTLESFTRILHPDDAERVMTTIQRALEEKTDYSVEFRIVRPDGQLLWLSDLARPIFNEDGKPLRLVGSVQDITDRKRAEKELLDKNAEMELFTYTVSHDLKSPLITIQSYAGMIAKDLEKGDLSRIPGDLGRISDASRRMGMLLDDLLELSRIGRLTNPHSTFDMGLAVKEVLEQMAGPLKRKRVEVTVQPDLPRVHGDQRRIAEVLQNLVENAVKYMGEQTSPRIEIGVRQGGSEKIFYVSDNGCGIDPRYHDTIFGLFSKLDPKSEGTGIGLALVKRIIEIHGGRVWLESEGACKGSTFCFTLPESH